MALSPDNVSMALFCDFENLALGVRDAKYDKFDMKRVLERLLLKGSIVVKKAYCDWERYKGFKAAMHEANFELIEIPHVRQSGKNSADIRLVVDALDLCYTKSHVNTFVILSGDSDFSPLVSKLRENAKQVIGVGVKQSTSDLLIANCDEFIFYDDLVREAQRDSARQQRREGGEPAPKRNPEEDRRRHEDSEKKQRKAFDLVMETFEALHAERGDGSKIRSSVLKDAIKRRRPDFNESYFGFRTFGALLDEAQQRGLLELERDEKGNVYAQRGSAPLADPAALRQGLLSGGLVRPAKGEAHAREAHPSHPDYPHDDPSGERTADELGGTLALAELEAGAPQSDEAAAEAAPLPTGEPKPAGKRQRPRRGRKPAGDGADEGGASPAPEAAAPAQAPVPKAAAEKPAEPAPHAEPGDAAAPAAKRARKSAPRGGRRPRKPAAESAS